MYCLLFSNNVHETENIKDHPAIKKTHLLSNRPELAFHAGEFNMPFNLQFLCGIGKISYY